MYKSLYCQPQKGTFYFFGSITSDKIVHRNICLKREHHFSLYCNSLGGEKIPLILTSLLQMHVQSLHRNTFVSLKRDF